MSNERFWGYHEDEADESKQFIMFANWNGGSSVRRFDAQTGAFLGKESGAGSDFRESFRELYSECAEVQPPYNVNMEERCRHALPDDILGHLRTQMSNGRPLRIKSAEFHKPAHNSILAGIDALIDAALGVSDVGSSPHYVHKDCCLALSANPISLDGFGLAREIFIQIESNWDNSRCRSKQNWRWVPMLDISDGNMSLEKTLEKAIVRHCPQWVNQIPTASGLQRDREERHRNIDLARELRPGAFEFVELKIGQNADTPLRAAFEILLYGLLWAFSVLNAEDLGYDVSRLTLLSARTIELKVLAPFECYHRYQLAWLEEALDAGLVKFASEWLHGREMRFRLERFPDSFRWPGAAESELSYAMTHREAVYPDGQITSA